MWEWNMGVVETAKWIVELVYGMGIYSGARGGFYETLTSARNSRLPVDRPCGTPQARCEGEPGCRITHPLLPSAQPLSPSQLLWRREQYYFSILSVYTSLRNPPTPLERTPACSNPAVLRVRTVLRVQPVSQLPLRWIASGLRVDCDGLRLDCDDGLDGLNGLDGLDGLRWIAMDCDGLRLDCDDGLR